MSRPQGYFHLGCEVAARQTRNVRVQLSNFAVQLFYKFQIKKGFTTQNSHPISRMQ